jgi:flagellar biosynthetic protein FlhB
MKGYTVAALPLLLLSGLVTIFFTAMQTKMLFATDALKFKGSRINPIEGFKKLFSIRSIVEVIKAVIKISVLGYIIYYNYKKHFLELPKLMDVSIGRSVEFTADIIMSIVKTTGAVFIFVAIFDYAYQWWEYEKNLRMTKQEVKEEYKQTEGDPQIKGKIREKQRQQAMNRMMQSVPNADVIVRNPTHFAIALKYDSEKDRAPMVLAKGMDNIAFRIIAEAEKYNIPMIENRPLARGLYDAVEINMEIPEEFYKPVAEVLAFVYNLKKKDLK